MGTANTLQKPAAVQRDWELVSVKGINWRATEPTQFHSELHPYLHDNLPTPTTHTTVSKQSKVTSDDDHEITN